MKKALKYIVIGLAAIIFSLYFLVNFSFITIGTLLKISEKNCKLESNKFFKIIAGKRVKINDAMLIAFNFKEDNYTEYPQEKHLYFKKDYEKEFNVKDLKERINLPFKYLIYDNKEVLKPVACYSPQLPPVVYIVFENSKKELFYMSHFDFRLLNYTIVK